MADYRLIAFDLDGTILKNDKSLTARTADTLQRAAAAGAVLVPVTGRPLSGIPEEVLAVGGIRCAITSNGAVTTDLVTGEALRSVCVDRKTAAEIARLPMERGLIHSVFIGGLGYSEPPFSAIERRFFKSTEHEAYIRRSRRTADDLFGWIETAPVEPENIWMIVRSAEEQQELDAIIRASWPVKTILTGKSDIEVGNPAADKGLAVTALAKMLGIPRREVLAFGDNSNDIGMLKAAGTGVAMANGTAEAKAAADLIAASNEADGVAAMLERLLGI